MVCIHQEDSELRINKPLLLEQPLPTVLTPHSHIQPHLIENMSGKKVQKALVKRWRWKKTEMTAASAVLAADQRVDMTGAKVVTMADFSWSSDGARCVCKETAEPQNITDAQAIKTVLQELLSHYKAQTTGGLLLQMLPHDYWAG